MQNGNEVQAQYLKTGDIIAIKNEPMVVSDVIKVTGSVSVEIMFSTGFKHLTTKSTPFKVIAREDQLAHAFTPGGLNWKETIEIVPDIALAAFFILSIDEIENSTLQYIKENYIKIFTNWIIEHKDKIFFGDKVLRDNEKV